MLEATSLLAEASAEERGAVFTQPKVVDFMLDLLEYSSDRDLTTSSILEPSFGNGGFLLAITERLLASYQCHRQTEEPFATLRNAVRGVELHRKTAAEVKLRVVELIRSYGIDSKVAHSLANVWITQDDFLLTPINSHFTHIVGNPPYVRQEAVAPELMNVYRSRYKTIYDRADLYIPFIERCLSLLTEGGHLSFICSDRWMKNRYGARLRQLIADGYHVKHYVDMVGTEAFQQSVAAYPAITTFTKADKGFTTVARQPRMEAAYLEHLAKTLNDVATAAKDADIEVVQNAVKGNEPWLFDSATHLRLIRELEDKFVPLEQAGCKVGIGVASGCDRVYIAPYDELNVEEERKLPLSLARDVSTGQLVWSGHGIVNPFKQDGTLINLSDYPKFAAFLQAHKQAIANRHIAKKNPKRWFRTIDRIYPELTVTPKLLIPDLKDKPTVVYDEGTVYPHHNLYWVVSDAWHLRALQAVLRSNIAKLFVGAYSVKMRGGWLRFQAQNLRRICLPDWQLLEKGMQEKLVEVSDSPDLQLINEVVYELYGLEREQIEVIETL